MEVHSNTKQDTFKKKQRMRPIREDRHSHSSQVFFPLLLLRWCSSLIPFGSPFCLALFFCLHAVPQLSLSVTGIAF